MSTITGAAPPTFLDRAVASTSATADIGLRTMAASIVGATIAPFVLSGRSLRFETEQLAFYESIALAGDASRAFVAPVGGVRVTARRARPPGWIGDRGRVELLDFESPFVALNPEARVEYAKHTHNRTARSQHWRHADRPRPTIVVLHGFMASPYPVNAAFFSLPWFFAQGYDVLLVTLPFHGRRRAPLSPYSGHGFFAHGLAHLNEAVLQAVHDIRIYVRHLLDEQGAPAVGITGLSLGGYTTAAVAAAEPRIHFAIPNAAVTEMGSLIRQWWPAGALASLGLRSQGLDFADLSRYFAVHSPLTYAPAIAKDRLFVIGGLGDRLAPPDQSERLWEHWDRCKLHWYPGNHVVHVRRGDYLREMGRFLNTTGFRAGLD